jgi:hypothetical protein
MHKKPYQRTSSGWSDERRAKHSASMRAWAPWTKSTGPRTAEGKSISRCNSLKHGGFSRPAKDFMAHFRGYYALLKLCFQKKRELLQIQRNELLNKGRRRPAHFPCNPMANLVKHRFHLAGAVGRCQLHPCNGASG